MSKITVTLTFSFEAPDLLDMCGGNVESAKECIKAAIRPELKNIRAIVEECTEEVPFDGYELVPALCYSVSMS